MNCGNARLMRPRPRRAFTVIELLVVIAIIGILIAILLPVISKARAAAMKTVCTSRIRDLSMAALQFRDDHKKFPDPARDTALAAISGLPAPAVPHHIPVTLINSLQPYFKRHEIPEDLPVNQLSPTYQCPFVEGVVDNRGPFLAGTKDAYYYTGYAYLARLDEGAAVVLANTGGLQLPAGLSLNVNLTSMGLPTLLKQKRSVNARGTRRGPLWADDIHYSLAPSPSWTYWHRNGTALPGPVPNTVANTKPILGQHVAFSDGSVQWVPANDLKLDVSDPPAIDLNASFKVPGVYVWWF